MAYDVASLVPQVQRWAKDPTLDPTLVIEFLDDTQQDVLGKQIFSFMERTEKVQLAVNDTEHAYPADHQSSERIWLVEPDDPTQIHFIEYKQPNDFFETVPDYAAADPNIPRYWTDFGRTIYWSAPLREAYNLINQYIKKPAPLTQTTDVPDIPESFKGILLYGALARVEGHRENFDIAALHDLKKEERLEDMALRYSPRQMGHISTNQSPWRKTGGS